MAASWALRRGTSAVDWCEGNYLISPIIAEFVNTISNILFLLFPPLLTRLFHQYAKVVTPGIYLVWALLLVVGLSSIYFHATLSLVGQLLDEVAILWLMMAAFALWFPRRYLPTCMSGNRKLFQQLILVASVAGSILACIHPATNAFFLMFVGLPSTILMGVELRRCRNARVVRLGLRCTIIWLVALACWINDRLFCDMWSAVNFPYLHGAWHLLIAIVAYTACVLFAYFDAWNEVPEKVPVLMYWPTDKFELGVPYVILQNCHNLPQDHLKI